MEVTRRMIEPASALAIQVEAGSVVRVIDPEGSQVADVMFFRAASPAEHFSQNLTRIMAWTDRLTTGHTLYSNLRTPLVDIVEDTVGRHDTYFCSCNSHVYSDIFRVGHRDGCHELIAQAVEPFEVPATALSDPFNAFQVSGFDNEGAPYLEVAASGPGDFITFRAREDLVVAASSCPDDISECNGGRISPIVLELR